MNFLQKLATALRGGATEVGEAIVDSQALRILDQEIRDADARILKARDALVSIKAKHKLAVQRVDEHNKNITNWEQKALAALNKGEEGLATECAVKIAELTSARDQEKAVADQFGSDVEVLSNQVAKTEGQIKSLRQQADLARARDSVQSAQISGAAATGGANGSLETAVGTLARLKQQQNERQARLDSAEELNAQANGSDLEKRLQEAGIGAKPAGADEVLSRLRAQAQGQANIAEQ
ncbi:PspA/IM30 family protein [Pseudomonas sp. NPDC089569]|uniref:PspA/IM30 family protein n=1 Tax=Pseudomonas sp. NPDC089569 TaxID=3390722 RepID=UPI003D089F2F